ncbi:MAG: nucleotidyltransferase family protein [Clostridiales bacterium]|nr:nucleotidyltransferase family protein [Clostridiales bacterium]
MNTVDAFTALLRCAVTGSNEKIDLGEADPELLYTMSKAHDLAHLVFYELKRLGITLPDEVQQKFKKQYDIALYRHVKRTVTTEQIRAALERAKIPFVLLKGSVLLNLYPEAWMRTSSDVDVLVREADHKRAAEAFKEIGWKTLHESPHDLFLVTPSGFSVELHHTLIEENRYPRVVSLLKRVWEYASPKEGLFEHELNDEFFFYYHIAHMVKHFENGGCGLRPIVDLWMLDHRTEHDREKRFGMLETGGIARFAEIMEELSEIWLSGKEKDPSLNDVEEYIINGGAFGTFEHSVVVKRNKAANGFTYYLRRLFLPYDQLRCIYPILKKCPILLPFCWIARWFRLLNPNVRKRTISEIGIAESAGSEAERIGAIMKQLGIS